ncbi:MAG: glycosyltransferase family 2 protein [Brevundimonas sp.]
MGPLIVVPCLNEARHLPGLLRRLLADPGAGDALIVVADGGSTDGSRDIVAILAATEPRLRLLDNPLKLQGAGVNAAVRTLAEGRAWLVRVDAHADYPADYVARLVGAAKATGAASVVVPLSTRGEGCFQAAVAVAQNSRIGTGGAAHRVGGTSGWIDHGHHALMRIADFVAVGGYDESFSHNEDAELDLRLTRAGGRIWMQADLAVGYYPRATPGALFRQYFNYGRGRARTAYLHQTPLKARQLAPLVVAPTVGLGVLSLALIPLCGWAVAGLVPAGLWAGVCLIAGVVAGVRARSPCGLMSGLAAMIMHLAWSAGFLSRAAALAFRPRRASRS